MAYVSFISDERYREIVSEFLQKAVEAKRKAEEDFSRNVIDPFSVVLEMGGFDVNVAEWTIGEKIRQAQKSVSNHIGVIHQKILGSVAGFRDLGVGEIIDVVNEERKIIAEIKNKYNTIKGSNKIDLYNQLHGLVMHQTQRYHGYTSYYVEIIPKTPARYNIPFTPSDSQTRTRAHENSLIRQIDGASFYALVTGREHALKEIFSTLPQVIKDCKPIVEIDLLLQANDFFTEAFGQ